MLCLGPQPMRACTGAFGGSVGVVGGRDSGVAGHHLDRRHGRERLTLGDHVAEVSEVLHVEVRGKGVDQRS